MFCTLAQVKERLGISSKTEYDAVITTIISGLTGVFESLAERPLLVTAAAVTEYYTGLSAYLQLRRYPVVAVTSIKLSWAGYNWSEIAALSPDIDYRLIGAGEKGIVKNLWGPWPQTDDGIQVVYRGGFCAAGVAAQTGEHALPADLNEAAIHQACFFFKRKDDPGLSGISFEGGSFQKYAQDNLLPMVRDTVLARKRLVM